MKKYLFLIVTLVCFHAQAQVPYSVPTNGLVGYWPFTGNANDVSGNGNNGTFVGASTLTADRFGIANSAFQGGTSYVTCPSTVFQFSRSSNFSISAWFTKSTTDSSRLLSTENPEGNFRISINGSGALSIQFGDYLNHTINDTNWHHLVYTYENRSEKIYVDGVLITTNTDASTEVLNYGSPFTIGAKAAPSYDKWNGKIDDIGVWNRVLTPQEITNIYTHTTSLACLPTNVSTTGLVGYWPFCGNANDESGNGNNGTVNGATLTTDRNGNANSAYSFNGSSSYINCGNPSIFSTLNNFTISTWINPTNISNNTTGTLIKVILSKYGGYSDGYILGIFNNQSEIRIHGQSSQKSARSNNLVANNWVHVVAIKDGLSLKIYMDNVLLQTTDLSSFTQTLNTTSSLTIGKASWSPTLDAEGYFNGKIDDIGIWNRALTAQEIANLYAPCTIPTTAPTGIANQTFCATPAPTIANLMATGTAIQWYTAATGGLPLATTTTLVDGTTYYASQTLNSCESTDRLAVTVDFNDPQITASATTICTGSSVTLTASTSATSLTNVCVLPTNLQTGLVGYWPFCGNANDRSGSNNNGTVNGATLTVDRFGNLNSAYSFDGNNDYIVTPANGIPSSGIFTVSFWLKMNAYYNQINDNVEFIDLGSTDNTKWGIASNYQGHGRMNYGKGCNDTGGNSLNSLFDLNTWNHYVFRTNDIQTEIFKNGVLVGTTSNGTSGTCTATNLYFGTDIFSNQENTNMELDDVMIWNSSKTNTEISQIYNTTQTTYLWSTGATTASISPSPTTTTTYWCDVTVNGVTCRKEVTITVNNIPSVPIGNATQVFCTSPAPTVANLTATGTAIQWYATATGGTPLVSTTALVNGSTYYASQTVATCESPSRLAVTVDFNDPQITASATTVCSGTAVTLTAATTALSTSNYTTLPTNLQNGLVGYWPFNGNANDLSGNNNNGTVNGATLTTDRFGNANSAYYFNNSYIQIPSNSTLNNPQGSVSFWMNSTSTNLMIPIKKNIYIGANNEQYSFALNYTNLFSIKYNSLCQPGNGWSSFGGNNNLLMNGNWHMVTATFSTSVKIYIDGLLISSNVAPNPNADNCPGDIQIGREWSSLPNYFIGKIDDIAIYNRALSASEITQLFNTNQTTYLWSTGATTATINPTPTTTTNYWCDVTVNGVTCRKEITITVNPNITPVFTQISAICSGATLTALPTTSTNSITGTWSPALNNTSTTTYTFTPTAGQCATTTSMGITVNAVTSVPTGNATQVFCASPAPTVASLTATGTGIQWYAAATGGSPLASTTTLVDGTTYYASQTVATCESPSRLAVTVDFNDPQITASATTVCSGTPVTLSIQGQSPFNKIDFSSKFNSNPSMFPGASDLGSMPSGNVTFNSTPFYISSWTNSNNSWNAYFEAGNNPRSLVINVTSQTITELNFLANTFWGISGPNSYASVELWNDTQMVFQKNFIGNIDIRDYIQNTYTNSINNTTSVNAWNNGVKRIDNQKITLPNPLLINKIIVRDTGLDMSQRIFVLAVTTKTLFFEPTYLWSTGETTPTINPTPTTSTNYWCDVTVNGVTCRKEITINVTTNTVPTFTQVADICSGATLSALPSTSTNGITGTWSPALNNASTTTYTFTPTAGQCATTSSMGITVNAVTPAPTGNATQVFCTSPAPTVAQLTATGTGIQWYATATGGTPLVSTTVLVDGSTYYASQTVATCESPSRLAVTVDFNDPQITASATTVCSGTAVTLTAATTVLSTSNYTTLPTNLQNGLVGYWPFNGNANDLSGNNNNGTVNGASLTLDRFGNPNSAYNFNTYPNYIQFPEISNTLGSSNSATTISIWSKSNHNYPNGVMIHSASPGFQYQFARIEEDAINKVKIYNRNPSTNNEPTSIESTNSSDWNHIVAVIDGINGNYKLYINGNLSPSMSFNFDPTQSYYSNSRVWQIGAISFDQSYHQFTGKIDDLSIFNRALSQSEIAQLYNNNLTAYAWSTGETTATINPSPTATTTYWCDVTVNGVTCRKEITINVNSTTPAPTGDANQVFCVTPVPTVASLTATGSAIQWYDVATGGSPLASTSALVDGTTYYASQTVTACESPTRLAVTVDFNDPQITASATTVCSGTPVTLTASTTAAALVTNCTLPINLQNGLVGYWPFCGNANDVSGNNNNGTVNGATLTTDRFGNVDSAYSFDGINDWISLNGPIEDMENFTISAWVYHTGQSYSGIFSDSNNVPAEDLFFNMSPNEVGIHADKQSTNLRRLVIPGPLSGPSAFVTNQNLNGQWQNIFWTLSPTVSKIYLNGINVATVNSSGSNIGNHNLNPSIGRLTDNFTSEFYPTQFFHGKIDNFIIWSRILSESEIQQLANSSSYIWSTGETTATINPSPTATTTYWCDVTVNGVTCRKEITINVNAITPAPTGNVTQVFCVTPAPTVASLTATGTAIQWYDVATGGLPLASTSALVDGTTYYASQTVTACESPTRLAVTVDFNEPQITASATTVCSGTPVTLTASTTALALTNYTTLPSNLQNGLVGYWPFNGNANDLSGNSNNGTVNGTTLTTDRFGNANGAYGFNGSNWIEIANANTLNLSNGTLSLWFQSNDSGLQTLLAKNVYGTAQNENYEIQFSSTNTIDFLVKYNSNCTPALGWNIVSTPNNYVDASIHHLVCVIDTNLTKIFVDGVLKNTLATPNASADICLNSPLFFGRDYAVNQLYNFKGKLDDIAIYNRALSPIEIAQLYNNNLTAYAWSTGETTATINPSPTATTTYWCDVTVNGVTCRKEVTINVNSTTPAPTGNTTQVFCVTPVPTVASLTATGTAIQWYDVATGGSPLASTTALVDGTTYYASQTVTACESPTRLAVTVDFNDPQITASATTVCSGTPVTLTASTTAAILETNCTLPTNLQNGLVGYWPFCGNAYDVSGNGNNGYVNGATLTTDSNGNSNSAYYLSGINQTIDYNSTPFLGGAQVNSFTIKAKVNINSLTNSPNIWGKTYNWGEVNLFVDDNGAIYFRWANSITGNKYSTIYSNSGVIQTNNWYEITVVFNNGTGQLYINGNSISTNLQWVAQGGTILSNTQIENSCNFAQDSDSSKIGVRITSGSPGNYLNGIVDEFTIWNRSLSQTEIQQSNNVIAYQWSTGETTPSINPTPATTTTYWCDVTVNGVTCRKEITINVTPNAVPTFTQVADICSGATLGALPTTSTNGVTGTWSPILDNTATTTYTFTPDAGLCATTATMTINVNAITPAPTGNVTQVFCVTPVPTIASLSATGTAIQWYDVATGGSPLASTTALVDGTTYYASQTVTACESPTRLAVTVDFNDPQITASATTVCIGTPVTLTASTTAVPAISNCTLPTNLQNGLVGYWPFCGNANDVSLNGHDGVVNGATLTSDRFGNTNSAYVFDGNDNITTNVNRGNLGNSMSISVFYKYTGLINVAHSAIIGSKNTTSTDFFIGKNNFSTNIGVQDGNYEDQFVVNSNAFDGNWHNIIYTFNNNIGTIYLDGVLKNSGPFTKCKNSDLIIIGNEFESTGYTFYGAIDDVVFWNRLLTPQEITQMYNVGQTTYLWSTGETIPSINPTPATTTTYWCDVTVNGVTCRKEITINVTPNTVPTFTQVADICSGATLAALPTTSTNGVTGTWSPALDNTATTTYTFTPDAGLCATTTTMTINVNPNIVPTFTQVTDICSGAALVALPTTSNNGITGTWSPAINNGATTEYTFIPTVGLCATTTTMTITVNPNIAPTFTQVAAICAGATLSPLPTTSNNGITGTWSPALNNMASTTYTFTPTLGLCAITATMTINVLPNVVPTFTQVAEICAGATLAALPTTSTNGVTGTWSPAINNMGTTTYTFNPTAGQCASTTTMTITVNPNITPVFTQVPAICSGDMLAPLPTTSNNGITGTWSPSLINTMTLTYTFTPTAGLCATTTTMTITVNRKITPLFSQMSAVCAGTTMTDLPTTSLNGVIGTWSPALNNMATTTYTFTPAVGQCAFTKTMTVVVNPIPATPSGATDQNFCQSDAPKINDILVNGTNVVWFSSATTNFQLSGFTNLIDGSTYYAGSYNPITGCQSTSRLAVTVHITTIEAPVVEAQIKLCEEDDPTIASLISNGSTLIYYDAPINGNALATTYELDNGMVIYAAQFDTQTGCESVERSPIQIEINNCKLVIYNLITIDGNQANDRFRIENIENYPTNSVQIFNRNGQLIWKTDHYDNVTNAFIGKATEGFVLKGDEYLPTGTYFYVISYYDDFKGETKQVKGFIQIDNKK
jgi:hypothetical protein